MPKDWPDERDGRFYAPRWEMFVVGALSIGGVVLTVVGWLRALFG